MKRSRGTAGFTLAELLIVVSIIGILVAVAIPVFSAAMSRVEEGACQANRASLLRQLVVEQMTDEPMTKEEFQKRVKEIGITCPTKGTYTAAQGAGVAVSVTCNKHGKSEGGEGGEDSPPLRVPGQLAQDYENILHEWSEKNPGKDPSNDRMRKAFYEANGNQWPKLKVGDTILSVQPFLKEKVSGEFKERIFIFARADATAGSGWNTNYLYNPADGKWYHSNNGVSVTKFSSQEDLYKELEAINSWDNKPKWRVLEKYEELPIEKSK